jgi:hypothetical protein
MTIAADFQEERSEPREPVLYRTRLTGADGVERSATLVNVSPSGFMARCDTDHLIGDVIAVALPRFGKVSATVRWSLGGRIGCQLQQPYGLSAYHVLLKALPRG